MELRDLHVTRLPGIDTPFDIAGRPGLNLVIGPNGSGKSSLSRAALGLLWPAADTTGHIVSATWTADGKTWLAERAGGPTVTWQCDGEAADAPALVTAHQSGIYRLGVLDLLKATADRTDAELALEIRRQLAGGVDLAAVRKLFDRTGQEGRAKAQALDEVRRRIRELLTGQRQLADEESRLGDLQAQLREATEAAGRRDALIAGRNLAAAMRALQDAVAALSVFPPVMARLHGDEDQRLAAVTAARDGAVAEMAAAAEARATAVSDRDAADLADGGPDDATLALLRELLAEARELATEVRGADEELAAAVAAVDTTGDQLGSIVPAPGDAVTVEVAAAAVTRLRERDRERAVRDGLDRLLGRDDLRREGTAAAEPSTLEAGRKALGNWLAVAAPAVPWPLRLLPWLASAGLLTVGVALAPWRTGAWTGWVALGLGVTLMPVWWLSRRRFHRHLARRRDEARAAFAATEIAEPEIWNREAVGHTLRGLLAQEAAAVQARLREQLRLALQGERDQAAGRLGDDDADAELDQTQVLQRVAAWHAATAAMASAEKRQQRLAGELDARRDRLGERLAPWWQDDTTDLATLAAAVTDLDRRRDRHRDAVKRLATATSQHAAAETRHAAATTDIAALLAPLELAEATAPTALADLLGRRDAYRTARETVDRFTVERDRCHRLCDELQPPLDATAREALALPTAELAAAIDAAAAQASRSERLLEEITEIRTRVRAARGDAQLSAARVDEEAFTRDLAAIRDTVRGNALATLLLERAAASYEAATEPPLLRRTQDLFARFTDGRYGLTVVEGDDGAGFLARDTGAGRGLALAELSDGTRAQLLLAARLAALPEHERDARPPLFLDESLTASDPVRFAAIGKAILDLVRQNGRQVFYLTCDAADVAAWQDLLAASGAKPAPVIDLAKVRGLAAAAAPDRLRPRNPLDVPAPGDDTAAYGELLGVPPLAPDHPLEGVHLFHLLRDDLTLLHDLLRRRVTTVGELTVLIDDLLADGVLDTVALERLRALGRAVTAFLDAFATGRGRPIPAGALLHQSGIETSKLAEVEALAGELDGDATRLLAALNDGRIKRLQVSKKDEIADWLTAAGYLDRRPRLDGADVRLRTLRALRSDLAGGHVDWEALDLLIDAWWVAAGGESPDDEKT